MDESIKYVEKNYPQTARAFKSIQHDQYALFCKNRKTMAVSISPKVGI